MEQVGHIRIFARNLDRYVSSYLRALIRNLGLFTKVATKQISDSSASHYDARIGHNHLAGAAIATAVNRSVLGNPKIISSALVLPRDVSTRSGNVVRSANSRLSSTARNILGNGNWGSISKERFVANAWFGLPVCKRRKRRSKQRKRESQQQLWNSTLHWTAPF